MPLDQVAGKEVSADALFDSEQLPVAPSR